MELFSISFQNDNMILSDYYFSPTSSMLYVKPVSYHDYGSSYPQPFPYVEEYFLGYVWPLILFWPSFL